LNNQVTEIIVVFPSVRLPALIVLKNFLCHKPNELALIGLCCVILGLCIRAGGVGSSQKRLWQNSYTDSSFLRSRRLMSEKEVSYSIRQVIS